MTFEEALRMSMKSFWNGKNMSEYAKASGKRLKYTKKYFDKLFKENNIENPWIKDNNPEGV